MRATGNSRVIEVRREVFLLRWMPFVFIFGGVLAISYAAFAVLYSDAYQFIELRKFEHAAPLVEPHLPAIGETIGTIQIPRLGIKALVVQGDDLSVLDRAIGHLPETAMPGEWGNVALAGHRDRLFRPLRDIRAGDAISIATPTRTFSYEVQSTFVVPATQVEVLRPSEARQLTLITCFPFHYVGHAPYRFIVKAREVAAGPR